MASGFRLVCPHLLSFPTHAHTYTLKHTPTSTCTHTYTHRHTHAQTLTHTYTHARTDKKWWDAKESKKKVFNVSHGEPEPPKANTQQPYASGRGLQHNNTTTGLVSVKGLQHNSVSPKKKRPGAPKEQKDVAPPPPPPAAPSPMDLQLQATFNMDFSLSGVPQADAPAPLFLLQPVPCTNGASFFASISARIGAFIYKSSCGSH